MNNKLNFAIIVINIIGITSCTTLSKEECLRGDWHNVGYQDGTRGYLTTRFEQHQKACADFNIYPDLQAYQNGHRKGLTRYCTPNKGFELGEQVQDYNGVCPSHLETTFIKQYQRGLETIRRFNQEKISKQAKKRQEQQTLLIYLEDETKFQEIKNKIKETDSNIERLKEKDRKIRQLLEKAKSMIR